MTSKNETLYKVTFANRGRVYEVFAGGVCNSALLGFIELSDLQFGKASQVVVDPSVEALRSEFADVSHTHIPVHTVIRIDTVTKRGEARVTELGEGDSKVTPFPVFTPAPDRR